MSGQTLPEILGLRRAGPEPLYAELAHRMEQAMEAGSLKSGSRLQPESQIAKELHLARATVRRAWSRLEAKGLITRNQKTGTFVM